MLCSKKWYKTNDDYYYYGTPILDDTPHCDFVGDMFIDKPHSIKPQSIYKVSINKAGTYGFHRPLTGNGFCYAYLCINDLTEIEENEVPLWCRQIAVKIYSKIQTRFDENPEIDTDRRS